MTLLDRIRAAIFGVAPPARPRMVDEDDDDMWERARRAADARPYNVSTPADDPVMDDIAASGVKPASKLAGLEQARNPGSRPADRLN